MYSKEQAKELRLEFWKKLENRTRKLPGQRGRVKKWILDNTGIKGLDLRFDVDRERAVVALEINHKDEDRRIKLFEKLQACKSIFETEYGDALNWEWYFEKESGQNVCRVFKSTPGDIYREETWHDVINFLIEGMIKMEKAFLEVRDFLKHDEIGQ